MAFTCIVIAGVNRLNPAPPIPASAAARPAEAHHPQKSSMGMPLSRPDWPPRRNLIAIPTHQAPG
jgi:hypothetical protein